MEPKVMEKNLVLKINLDFSLPSNRRKLGTLHACCPALGRREQYTRTCPLPARAK